MKEVFFSRKILVTDGMIHGEFQWMLCHVSHSQQCNAPGVVSLAPEMWNWIKLQIAMDPQNYKSEHMNWQVRKIGRNPVELESV